MEKLFFNIVFRFSVRVDTLPAAKKDFFSGAALKKTDKIEFSIVKNRFRW